MSGGFDEADVGRVDAQELVELDRLFEPHAAAQLDQIQDMGLGVGLEEDIIEQTADQDLSTGKDGRHPEPTRHTTGGSCADTADLGDDLLIGPDHVEVHHVQEPNVASLR